MAVLPYLIKNPSMNLELICEGDFKIKLSKKKKYSIRVELNTVSFFFPPEEEDEIDDLILYIPLVRSDCFLEIYLSKAAISLKRKGYLVDLYIDANLSIVDNIDE